MGFSDFCKSILFYLALSPHSQVVEDHESNQCLLPGQKHDSSVYHNANHQSGQDYPSFVAPGGPQDGIPFICEYPSMTGWIPCSTDEDRSCWLQGPEDFNITTPYEIVRPTGIVREYVLTADKMAIDADGIIMPEGKVFNQSYPGPWIQACWGDTIKITVVNNLQYNGTTVHWHGIRQLGTPEMDGVNAVSQCPITPGDSYTYIFNATQYGTSWYHSHYSLQYADGILGPITIHGPSSSEYDESLDPILISDWGHRSAFEDWYKQLNDGIPSYPKMNSVLLNGIGNFAGQFPQKVYNATFEKVGGFDMNLNNLLIFSTQGKKYLLRIINTSLDTDYIFSIDNHNFTVISSDFVPIVPYNTSNIAVAIGQRYEVIVHAVPNDDNGEIPPDGNFWIRTISSDGCSGFEKGNEPGERQGILRYNASSTGVPTTTRPAYATACHDEDPANLVPVVNWTVPPIQLDSSTQRFNIGKDLYSNMPEEGDNFFWWAFGNAPMWLNFSDPTILNLDNTTWNPNYVVVHSDEDQIVEAWVYMVVTAPLKPPAGSPQGESFWPVAHPMHFHGHDLVMLGQGTDSTLLPSVPLKFDNPPRRDTVLITSGGYVVIAWKADNPGAWLFHCHIPWHASNGLAIQVLERQQDFAKMMTPERLERTKEVCQNWRDWYDNPKNRWNPTGPFQEDSGI